MGKREAKVWRDAQSDFLSVTFDSKDGYMVETTDDRVMARVDERGNITGLYILGLSTIEDGNGVVASKVHQGQGGGEMTLTMTRRRFSVKEYYKMADAGIFCEDDRVELIYGEIVQMAAIGSYHAGCVNYLNTAFSLACRERAVISVQNPLRLNEESEPQPDIVLLRPREDFYTRSHPGPEDVLLVIEVSHSTVEYDRDVKAPLYAQALIPELWLTNLEDGYINAYTEPNAETRSYGKVRRFSSGERIAPLLLPDATLSVDRILGYG